MVLRAMQTRKRGGLYTSPVLDRQRSTRLPTSLFQSISRSIETAAVVVSLHPGPPLPSSLIAFVTNHDTCITSQLYGLRASGYRDKSQPRPPNVQHGTPSSQAMPCLITQGSQAPSLPLSLKAAKMTGENAIWTPQPMIADMYQDSGAEALWTYSSGCEPWNSTISFSTNVHCASWRTAW